MRRSRPRRRTEPSGAADGATSAPPARPRSRTRPPASRVVSCSAAGVTATCGCDSWSTTSTATIQSRPSARPGSTCTGPVMPRRPGRGPRADLAALRRRYAPIRAPASSDRREPPRRADEIARQNPAPAFPAASLAGPMCAGEGAHTFESDMSETWKKEPRCGYQRPGSQSPQSRCSSPAAAADRPRPAVRTMEARSWMPAGSASAGVRRLHARARSRAHAGGGRERTRGASGSEQVNLKSPAVKAAIKTCLPTAHGTVGANLQPVGVTRTARADRPRTSRPPRRQHRATAIR